MPTRNNKSVIDAHVCKLNILLNTQFNATEIFCNCLKDNKYSKPYNRIGKHCEIIS